MQDVHVKMRISNQVTGQGLKVIQYFIVDISTFLSQNHNFSESLLECLGNLNETRFLNFYYK